MPNLALHIKLSSSDKNPSAIILTYYRDGEAGGFMRSLKHRGVALMFQAFRYCSEEEYSTESHPWRYTFLPYKDWDALFEDERKWTDDPEWFAQLEKLRKRYPWFRKSKLAGKAKAKPNHPRVKPAKTKVPVNQLQFHFPEPDAAAL